MIIDKNSILQIFGSLMKHPYYLSETDKYNLTPLDFHTKLDRNIFVAIHSLYNKGVVKISPIDIENFFETSVSAKNTFQTEGGIEYLQDAEYMSDQNSFPYYYGRLKKFNVLNDLKEKGWDISRFYIENLADPKATEVNNKFENLEITEIFTEYKKELLGIEKDYTEAEEIQSWNIADEIDSIIGNFGAAEGIGLPLNGSINSTIINGAELGALTIRSGSSGLGKSRLAVSDACKLAYPFFYDLERNEWVKNGHCEKVLFIMTEQKPEQIFKMVLSYLTGINETKFRYNTLTDEERRRVATASKIVKEFRNNFQTIRIPNPSIQVVKNSIREKVIVHEIKYVFYDYIFISPSLLDEFKGSNVRQDEALLMFATALKDIAIEQNVSVFTSTQVNAKSDDNKDIRNEASLAGGRSTINKADNGAIFARPTREELNLLAEICTVPPTHVFDYFKVRSGRFSHVRVWSVFDTGTLRIKDLFVTDAQLNPIQEIFQDTPAINWELDESVNSKLKIFQDFYETGFYNDKV